MKTFFDYEKVGWTFKKLNFSDLISTGEGFRLVFFFLFDLGKAVVDLEIWNFFFF